jgi:hypothetical protein
VKWLKMGDYTLNVLVFVLRTPRIRLNSVQAYSPSRFMRALIVFSIQTDKVSPTCEWRKFPSQLEAVCRQEIMERCSCDLRLTRMELYEDPNQ